MVAGSWMFCSRYSLHDGAFKAPGAHLHKLDLDTIPAYYKAGSVWSSVRRWPRNCPQREKKTGGAIEIQNTTKLCLHESGLSRSGCHARCWCLTRCFTRIRSHWMCIWIHSQAAPKVRMCITWSMFFQLLQIHAINCRVLVVYHTVITHTTRYS